MIESDFNESNANVVLFTGGARQWTTKGVPSDSCALFTIGGSGLNRLCEIGQYNMGEAGTLASFIDFEMTCYPAENYGLVLWDHGGGSVAGFGADENFENDSMTLVELKNALEQSKSSKEKFEFIGFDACLMATNDNMCRS